MFTFSAHTLAEFAEADMPAIQSLISRGIVEKFPDQRNEAIDILVKALDALRQKSVEPLTFLQIGEFMETIGEPPPMFADRLIPDKQLILWSGRAKVGKSLAAYQIMEDVARGRPIFGEFELNRPGPVMYVGMEDGKHEINRRLRQRGLDPDDKELPIYVSTDVRDYGIQENVDDLKASFAALPIPPVLVVIDTITESFDCVRDWNDRNAIKRAFRGLRTFAQECCAVLAIIHNVKGSAEERESGDEIAGSLAVVSSSDGYLSCYKRRLMPDGNLQLFVRGGGRGGISPTEFIIEMDTNTYLWRWLDPEEQEQAKRSEEYSKREKLWDKIERAVLAKDGAATVIEISQHVNMSDGYVRGLVRDMLKATRLVKSSETRSNGAGKPAPVYILPDAPPSNNNIGTDSPFIGNRYNSEASEAVNGFFQDGSDEEEI